MNDTYYWIVVIFNIVWLAFLCFMHHWSRQDDSRDSRARGIHKRRTKAIERYDKKILRYNKRCNKKRAKRTAKGIKQIIRELKYAYTKGFDTFRPSPRYVTMYEALNACQKYCKDNNIEYKLCQCEFEFVSK